MGVSLEVFMANLVNYIGKVLERVYKNIITFKEWCQNNPESILMLTVVFDELIGVFSKYTAITMTWGSIWMLAYKTILAGGFAYFINSSEIKGKMDNIYVDSSEVKNKADTKEYDVIKHICKNVLPLFYFTLNKMTLNLTIDSSERQPLIQASIYVIELVTFFTVLSWVSQGIIALYKQHKPAEKKQAVGNGRDNCVSSDEFYAKKDKVKGRRGAEKSYLGHGASPDLT